MHVVRSALKMKDNKIKIRIFFCTSYRSSNLDLPGVLLQFRQSYSCMFETCLLKRFLKNENYDITRAMSSSRADPVLGHCPDWGYLDI